MALVDQAATECREELADLGSVDSNLLQMALVGLTQVAQEHATAISHLLRGGHSRSAVSLLRTLAELWIKARYVSVDLSGGRAAAYISHAPRQTLRYLNQIHRLVRETENPAGALASAGISSLDDLERRIELYEAKLKESDEKGVPALPNVLECAKAVDLEVTYRSVYGYLFSEVVHGGAGDTLRGVIGGTPLGDPYKVLITTYFIQVEMLELTNAHFRRPHDKAVETLRNQLKEFADDHTKSMIAPPEP